MSKLSSHFYFFIMIVSMERLGSRVINSAVIAEEVGISPDSETIHSLQGRWASRPPQTMEEVEAGKRWEEAGGQVLTDEY